MVPRASSKTTRSRPATRRSERLIKADRGRIRRPSRSSPRTCERAHTGSLRAHYSQSDKTGGGAGDGIRTRDILLGKQALCQLSYSRSGGRHCNGPPPRRQGASPRPSHPRQAIRAAAATTARRASPLTPSRTPISIPAQHLEHGIAHVMGDHDACTVLLHEAGDQGVMAALRALVVEAVPGDVILVPPSDLAAHHLGDGDAPGAAPARIDLTRRRHGHAQGPTAPPPPFSLAGARTDVSQSTRSSSRAGGRAPHPAQHGRRVIEGLSADRRATECPPATIPTRSAGRAAATTPFRHRNGHALGARDPGASTPSPFGATSSNA